MFEDGVTLDWSVDPLAALARWPGDRPVVMLHSGRTHARWSRYSVLAEPVGAYRFAADRSAWVGGSAPAIDFTHRPFRDLHTVLDADADALWVGYLGYDLGRWVERTPAAAADDRRWPILQFQRCPGFLVHDHTIGRWTAHGSYAQRPPTLPDRSADAAFRATGPLQPTTRADDYRRAVQRTLDYIAAGDIFQANLAQRFTAAVEGRPRAFFAALAEASPAWYGAHVELLTGPGEARRALCSTSPELFLEVKPDGTVTTRPIKGTAPASVDPATLRDSAKDTAELTMIVDLLRNDLGRVCDVGSVRVDEPRTIESHPTVHHGVATITGRLHHRMGLIDLFRATLPGGSITGAPKVRAMQIIEALEPVRRGPYCGAIGYIRGGAHRARACFNLAIRTVMLEQDQHGRGRADFSVGGGIVADSSPEAEYQETLDKAAAMRAALGLS
jgi:para-aminobenzoate synthetase component 1